MKIYVIKVQYKDGTESIVQIKARSYWHAVQELEGNPKVKTYTLCTSWHSAFEEN